MKKTRRKLLFRLKVGKRYWYVFESSYLPPNTFGEADDYDRTVVLRKGMNKGLFIRTLLHELIHAVEFEYKVNIKHSIVHRIDGVLYRALKLSKSLK